MKRWVFLLLLAHHSVTGSYDTSVSISIEGTIREVHFVNPHPYLTVEATRDGKKQRWKMEMDNRSELIQIKMTATTLKNGDKIAVSGSPSRDGAPTLYIWRLDRPSDGFWYEQIDAGPRIGRR